MPEVYGTGCDLVFACGQVGRRPMPIISQYELLKHYLKYEFACAKIRLQ
jgi:hypothetical protein